jgi:hypothetical protein
MELLTFTAEQEDDAMLLAWRTGTEQGTSHFDVERAADARAWVSIGRVEAAGSSTSERAYAFRDGDPPQGDVYYRLRMVDADGSERWSPIVGGSFRATGPIVFPNPANGAFHVRTGGRPLEVLDALGRSVAFTTAGAQDGIVQVRLPGAMQGVYTVRLGGAGGPLTRLLLLD